MPRGSIVWAAFAMTAPAAGDGFVPVTQVRSIDVMAAAGDTCDDFMVAQSADFGPFEETLEVSVVCDPNAAMALSTQVSSIGETLLSVVSDTVAETQLGPGEFVFLLAFAGSGYNVTVDLATPARARVTGVVAAEAQAEEPPSFFVISAVTWSSDEQIIFEQVVQPALNAGPDQQTFQEIHRIEPGTYQLIVNTSAVVTDAFPVTGSFSASNEATVELFNLADLDLDGSVNVLDLITLLLEWGPCPGCVSDIDEDGSVTVLDLIVLLTAFGATGP